MFIIFYFFRKSKEKDKKSPAATVYLPGKNFLPGKVFIRQYKDLRHKQAMI